MRLYAFDEIPTTLLLLFKINRFSWRFGASDRILTPGPKGMFPGIGESVIVLYSFKV